MANYNSVVVDDRESEDATGYYAELRVDEGDDLIELDHGQLAACRYTIAEALDLMAQLGAAIATAVQNRHCGADE